MTDTAELAMLVRVLCHHLKKHDAQNQAIRRATDYLRRHGLSSPLREARGIGAEGQDAQRLGAEPAEPGHGVARPDQTRDHP